MDAEETPTLSVEGAKALAAALGLCDAGRLAQGSRGLRAAQPVQALLGARPGAAQAADTRTAIHVCSAASARS